MSDRHRTPSRWRLLRQGFAVVLVVALGFAGCVMSSMGVNLRREGAIFGLVYYVVTVLIGPLFFVSTWLRGGHVATDTLLISLAGVVPVAAHPIFQRRWAAAVTVASLCFWLLAALIVAGAPI